LGEGLHVCGYERCGKSFAEPVRLTDLSHKPRSETYYACPYCFSKMEGSDLDAPHELELVRGGGYEIAEKNSDKSVKAEAHKDVGKEASPVNCPHHVGYLKTRSKNEAVPDSCLTCSRILQCMV